MRGTRLLPAIAVAFACGSRIDASDADVRELVEERQRLLEAGRIDEADELCESWIDRTDPIAKAEGYKCSANVFVRRADDTGDSVIISDGDQRLAVGGTALPPRFSGDAIPRALDQLDRAAESNPSDRSIHQGRMFLALASGNYGR